MTGHPVGDDGQLDAVFSGYLAEYQRAWCGYPDVSPALDQVRAAGLATAVLTNGTTDQQHAKLAHLGLLGRVGPVLTSEGLGVAKPAAGAFHALCDQLRLAPRQVVYVGDDYTVDVQGALAAGLQAVHLDRTGVGPQTQTARIATLLDLASSVESIRQG